MINVAGDIVPATHAERLFVMLAAIAGGGLYAYLVGAVCGMELACMHACKLKNWQAT